MKINNYWPFKKKTEREREKGKWKLVFQNLEITKNLKLVFDTFVTRYCLAAISWFNLATRSSTSVFAVASLCFWVLIILFNLCRSSNGRVNNKSEFPEDTRLPGRSCETSWSSVDTAELDVKSLPMLSVDGLLTWALAGVKSAPSRRRAIASPEFSATLSVLLSSLIKSWLDAAWSTLVSVGLFKSCDDVKLSPIWSELSNFSCLGVPSSETSEGVSSPETDAADEPRALTKPCEPSWILCDGVVPPEVCSSEIGWFASWNAENNRNRKTLNVCQISQRTVVKW